MSDDVLDQAGLGAPPATVTERGKPQLRRADFSGLGPYRVPGGPLQARLATIWANVLRVDTVGIDDDFFALGGDSLAATVMFTEIERLVGRKVPTALLVKASTIAGLSRLLRGDPRAFAAQILVPMRTTGSRPPLILVHGHNGRVLFVQRLAWMLDDEQPVYAIQARGFDQAPPHESVATMIDDYVAELLKTFDGREIFLGGYCYGGILAIELHRRLEASGIRVRRMILLDPPVFPRQEARPYTQEELAALARNHSEGLARRLQQIAAGDPERAAWYAPGGQGYATAMYVAESLAKAYSGFVPQPTTAPLSLIWSAQFANALVRIRQSWSLAQGPTDMIRISLPDREVKHNMLLREVLPAAARRINEVIVKDLARSSSPAGPEARSA